MIQQGGDEDSVCALVRRLDAAFWSAGWESAVLRCTRRIVPLGRVGVDGRTLLIGAPDIEAASKASRWLRERLRGDVAAVIVPEAELAALCRRGGDSPSSQGLWDPLSPPPVLQDRLDLGDYDSELEPPSSHAVVHTANLFLILLRRGAAREIEMRPMGPDWSLQARGGSASHWRCMDSRLGRPVAQRLIRCAGLDRTDGSTAPKGWLSCRFGEVEVRFEVAFAGTSLDPVVTIRPARAESAAVACSEQPPGETVPVDATREIPAPSPEKWRLLELLHSKSEDMDALSAYKNVSGPSTTGVVHRMDEQARRRRRARSRAHLSLAREVPRGIDRGGANAPEPIRSADLELRLLAGLRGRLEPGNTLRNAVASWTPLQSSPDALSRLWTARASRRVDAALGAIREDYECGMELHETLACHPELFSVLAVDFVQVGLRGYGLPQAIDRYLEWATGSCGEGSGSWFIPRAARARAAMRAAEMLVGMGVPLLDALDSAITVLPNRIRRPSRSLIHAVLQGPGASARDRRRLERLVSRGFVEALVRLAKGGCVHQA